QRIPRILGAAEYCVAHLSTEGMSQGLADLGAAYCPWVAVERELTDIAQRIGREMKEALPPAQRLQALQQQALALQRWELAAKALTLVQRLVQISNADAQQEALKKLLNQM